MNDYSGPGFCLCFYLYAATRDCFQGDFSQILLALNQSQDGTLFFFLATWHLWSNLCSLQWMLRALITGPPGKPQSGAFHKNKTQSFQTRPRTSIWSAGSWTLRLHPCSDPLVIFLCLPICEQILPIRPSITDESAINNFYLKKWAIISMRNI